MSGDSERTLYNWLIEQGANTILKDKVGQSMELTKNYIVKYKARKTRYMEWLIDLSDRSNS